MSYPVKRSLNRVSRHFSKTHGGIDIAPLKKGTPMQVYAVGKGTIVGVGMGSWRAGKNVMIRLDGDGSLWWYGHLSSVGVKVGDRFNDGDPFPGTLTGNTGFSFGVHLHLERHYPRIDKDTDPWPYLKNEPSPETYRTTVTPKPAPRPSPAPAPAPRTVRVGSKIRLTSPWVRYTTAALTRRLNPNLPSGTYTVVGISNGNLRLQKPGYDGWVSGQAKAGLL